MSDALKSQDRATTHGKKEEEKEEKEVG
jgi:hypothetical protein